ncbi:hypothetical protein Lser_V15G39641 [Lactuca serriola]
MSRIHPSLENKSGLNRLTSDDHDHLDPVPVPVSSPKHTTLTVWKRSSMSFHGTDGFTVYDRNGKLAFRVDNYSRNSHVRSRWSCSSVNTHGGAGCGGGGGGGALVLMDGSGIPLITLKPQIFSIQNQWNGCIYREDDNVSSKSNRRIFMMRRPSSSMMVLGRTKNEQDECEAEVFFTGTTTEHQNHHHAESETGGGGGCDSRKLLRKPDFRIEGSFWNRNCKIKSTGSGEVAAQIMRKRTAPGAAMMSGGSSSTGSTIILSEEVFTLVVNPGFDPQLIMAFVVVLDRICFKPFFTHLMC